MQVVLHIGAHCTDEDRLLKALLKNKGPLAEQGVIVPGPGRYRTLIREAVGSLDCAVPTPEAQEALYDAIMDEDHTERLILSNENFFCVHTWIFSNGMFYGMASEKVVGLTNLFHGAEVEFHLALRNPATFLPAAFAKARVETFDAFMRGVDPRSLRWSQLVTSIRQANPAAPLTVWCNEDTPLIWGEILREVAGVDPMTKLSGGLDLLSEIMTRDGMKRFRSYVRENRPQTEMHKRRIMAAFLDKYAIEDAVEEEIDLPGWTQQLVEDLTAIYDEDVYAIERMPGVTFLSP